MYRKVKGIRVIQAMKNTQLMKGKCHQSSFLNSLGNHLLKIVTRMEMKGREEMTGRMLCPY